MLFFHQSVLQRTKAEPAAAPALAMPAFIVVLLRAGIATPTEVSVLAVFYGLIVSMAVYRDLTLRRLYDALFHTAVTTGVVMLVIAASNLVGYVLTVEAVPTAVAETPRSAARARSTTTRICGRVSL